MAYHQQLSTLCASLFTEEWSDLCAVLEHLQQHSDPHLLDDVFLMLFGVLQASELRFRPFLHLWLLGALASKGHPCAEISELTIVVKSSERFPIVPSTVSHLSALERIVFIDNQRNDIPYGWEQFPALLDLDLEGCPRLSECIDALVPISALLDGDGGIREVDFAVPDGLLTDADWRRLEQMAMLWLVQEHASELQALTALNLSGLGLTEVPPALFKLNGLQLLSLENNMISKIPEGFSHCSLKLLNVRGNPLESVASDVTVLRIDGLQWGVLRHRVQDWNSLIELDLSNCELSEIPAELANLPNLRTVKLGNNSIDSVAQKAEHLFERFLLSDGEPFPLVSFEGSLSIRELVQEHYHAGLFRAVERDTNLVRGIRKLNLSEKELSALPEGVRRLVNLEELYLGGNNLTSLPSWLGELSKLQVLHLSENQLTELPESISACPLECLSVMDNPLAELPQGIRALQIGEGQQHLLHHSLTELRYLYACACNWTTIPEVVMTYSCLELLDLSDNAITEYPSELGRLTSLTVLDLSDSALTEVPEFVGKLSALEDLNLSENQISEIKGLENLSSLFCDLRGNPIEQLPTHLNRLALDESQLNYLKSQNALGHIQELSLANQELEDVPYAIVQMQRLHELDISGNWIAWLPPKMGDLLQLKILNASDNNIHAIPENIDQWHSLMELNLSNNPIHQLPSALFEARNLQKVELRNCSLEQSELRQLHSALTAEIDSDLEGE